MFQVRFSRIASKNIINIQQHQRFITSSTCICKKYKYALDPKQNVSRGKTITNFRRKGKVTFVEGKALTYFQFDDDKYNNDDCHEIESPKQKAYAVIVQSAVESLLSSTDAPQEVQDALIEIVTVDVDPSLMFAFVVWKLPEFTETQYTKEETTMILERFMPFMKKLLPAHSTVTQTPEVQFVYDTISEKQKEIDEMFERLKLEEMEFLERTKEKSGPVNEVESLYVAKPKKKKKRK